MKTNQETSVYNGENTRWRRWAYRPGKQTRVSCKLYEVWCGMKRRCHGTPREDFHCYGGRGISVCQEWRESYPAFRKWALENGYRKGLTLDRKDSDGDYFPDNCRWADRRTQTYNISMTKHLTFRGETLPAPILARRFGLTPDQLRQRLRDEWTLERALTTPIQSHLKGNTGNRKVSNDLVRWARGCGLPGKHVADRLGVSITYARRIVRGEVYGDVR
jgi:hypothetical protein